MVVVFSRKMGRGEEEKKGKRRENSGNGCRSRRWLPEMEKKVEGAEIEKRGETED